jgi:hypothetical protein
MEDANGAPRFALGLPRGLFEQIGDLGSAMAAIYDAGHHDLSSIT